MGVFWPSDSSLSTTKSNIDSKCVTHYPRNSSTWMSEKFRTLVETQIMISKGLHKVYTVILPKISTRLCVNSKA